MPIPASQLEDEMYLRVLVMGPAKAGKSENIIATAPGPSLVLLCDSDTAMRGARRRTKNFDIERVRNWETMERGLREAREGVKANKYKTVIFDTLSDWASRLERDLLEATNGDGRRAYPEYGRRIDQVIEQLFRLQAHVIVITHYIETGNAMDGAVDKTGEGVVPLLAGKARAIVSARFNDVLWFEVSKKEGPWQKEPYNGRVFITGPQGVWGPGCRSLAGTQTLPADVKLLIAAFEADSKSNSGKSNTNTNQRNQQTRK